MTNTRTVCLTPVDVLNKSSANTDNCLDFVWTGETNQRADRILELAGANGMLRTRNVSSAGGLRALFASLTSYVSMSPWKRCAKPGTASARQWRNCGAMPRFAGWRMSCVRT